MALVNIVFPAPAGMNRENAPILVTFWGIPRASGDEPRATKFAVEDGTYSPRQRG